MRHLLRALAVSTTLALPSMIQAAPFTATLQVEFAGFGSLTFGGSGAGTSNGSLVALPTGFVSGQQTLVTTAPLPPLTQLVVKATNRPGSFTGSPLQGVMPVAGGFALKGFGGLGLIPFGGLLPFTQSATRGFGVGPAPIHEIFSGVNVTQIGAPWTAGTVTIVASGMTHTRMGSDLRTPGGLGSLDLVTPFIVRTNIAGTLPFFGRLHLTFVPEPGTLTLLAAGIAGLAARGAQRGRAARRRLGSSTP